MQCSARTSGLVCADSLDNYIYARALGWARGSARALGLVRALDRSGIGQYGVADGIITLGDNSAVLG
jgi:hypothetical protein